MSVGGGGGRYAFQIPRIKTLHPFSTPIPAVVRKEIKGKQGILVNNWDLTNFSFQ